MKFPDPESMSAGAQFSALVLALLFTSAFIGGVVAIVRWLLGLVL
jgi:hypothetical protein